MSNSPPASPGGSKPRRTGSATAEKTSARGSTRKENKAVCIHSMHSTNPPWAELYTLMDWIYDGMMYASVRWRCMCDAS